MADAEQIYQEVLSEEQGKGVSPAVAEGRAKAARVRAEHGSPHPKEAKWWPGAQPHLEGDGAAPAATEEEAPAEEEAAPEETAAEEPAAEEPAATEPQPSPAAAAAEAEPAQEPPTEEVAVEAAEQTPAAPAPAQPAEQPAAAAAAAVPEARPSGVTHGTTAGTRVRPEDAVTTEAQFQGQAAMYERRKLIDELIATGVPAAAAAETGERRSPLLALFYLLIPLLAIGIVLAQNGGGAAEGGEGHGEPAPGSDSGITITAANVAFDTDELTLPAGEETTVTLVNDDSVAHNLSIYTNENAEESLFQGQNVNGGAQIDYEVPSLEAGEYFFRCDLHPTAMVGTALVE